MKTKAETKSKKPQVKVQDIKPKKDAKGAGINDIKIGNKSQFVQSCWVARAVYGEDNPRWRLFRAWLLGDAPAWFRGLYLRHGQRFARWIAPHAAVKAVIRCWMDSVIDGKEFAPAQPKLA